jgi:hypothetical protein
MRLTASFFDLRSTLANFELGVAFADHVHSAATLDDLAVGVTVFKGADTADNFHGRLPSGDLRGHALVLICRAPETVRGAKSDRLSP